MNLLPCIYFSSFCRNCLFTCSNLVFIEITLTGWQTDWSNFGMRIETDGSFQLQKTNIIIQIVSLLVIRINFDLKKKY